MTSPDDFGWAFGTEQFSDFSQFIDAFTKYNQEFRDIEPPITDFPFSDSHSIELIFRGLAEDEEEYIEMKTTLSSREGKPLTFLEFMYLANNALYNYLVDADHIYFEGVDFEGNIDRIPIFRLVQGS